MTNGVKDVALVELPTQAVAESPVATFERLARDPGMDVEKFERLMLMAERMAARVARERFNAAMTAAQTDMRPIAADASNPQTKSKYASYAKLDNALRPIYTSHGFGVSFDTGEGAPAGWVRVLAYVTHAGGHDHTYHADMPADGKGAKGGDVMTVTHAVGAAMSYGMRYLLKMIFNVAVGEDDRDGNSAEPTAEPPKPPAGFDAWWQGIGDVVPEGLARYAEVWGDKRTDIRYRTYVKEHLSAVHEERKARAIKADKERKAGAA